MTNKEEVVQSKLIMEYFQKNPCREIRHPEVVDWCVNEYKKRTRKVFRDPDRAIRKLHQEGLLIKVKKGVYKYDPDFVQNPELEDFSAEQKAAILERDGYKCVVCGARMDSGVELQVDHIKAKDKGGRATIENGETLCSVHNFRKKNYNQTESGKKMFIRIYELAKVTNDQTMANFCKEVLKTFDKHNVNGHIPWKE